MPKDALGVPACATAGMQVRAAGDDKHVMPRKCREKVSKGTRDSTYLFGREEVTVIEPPRRYGETRLGKPLLQGGDNRPEHELVADVSLSKMAKDEDSQDGLRLSCGGRACRSPSGQTT